MLPRIHDALLLLHVAGGFVALVLLWIPLFSKKGGRLHRATGTVYVVAMAAVVATALGVSALSFYDPVALDPEAAALVGDPLADYLARRRMVAAFLGYLALITLASGWHGLGALRHKADPRAMRTPATLALFGITALAGVAMFVLGAVRGSMVFMGLAVVGPAVAVNGFRYVSGPAREPMAWWFAHMGGMIGTGIAANTAFLVFGANRLFPVELEGWLAVVPWLLPTLAGVPAIQLLSRKYRRRFAGRAGGVGG